MITLDHVTKLYKSSARPALDNISVKIDKGEFVFLIGPSGSGKSTFMRLLLAEEHPSSGDIRVSKFHVNKLAGRHLGHHGFHVDRIHPVVGGPGVGLLLGADEGAVLDAGHVLGVRRAPERVLFVW